MVIESGTMYEFKRCAMATIIVFYCVQCGSRDPLRVIEIIEGVDPNIIKFVVSDGTVRGICHPCSSLPSHLYLYDS
jgi:hypothetical protein